MQVPKESLQDLISATARQAFLEQGFAKTTMRQIADRSGVCLSNLYNYFENKDALFASLVQPLIVELNGWVNHHYDVQYMHLFIDYLHGRNNELVDLQVKDYMRMIDTYRVPMTLLFFRAQGSSLEHFLDEFTDFCTQQVIVYMEQFARLYPEFRISCSPFTYHLHNVWMFNLLCELIKHDISPHETERVIHDFLRFEYIGWRDLIRN